MERYPWSCNVSIQIIGCTFRLAPMKRENEDFFTKFFSNLATEASSRATYLPSTASRMVSEMQALRGEPWCPIVRIPAAVSHSGS